MPEWKREINQQLADLNLPPAREAEIVEEVAQHLDDRYRELLASGATDTDAHRIALEEISQEELLARGLERVEQQESREPAVPGGRGANTFLAGFWQDIRYGLRMLRKNPALTAVVVTTLALGIGANTALYSVVDSIFQRGLPAPSPDQLLGLSFHQDNNSSQFNFSNPDFEDIRQQENCFSQMFAYRIGLDGLDQGNRPEQIITTFVTGNYFPALNMKPALGRLLLPTEGAVPGSDPVLVLGYTYWRGRFGGDPGIIGKQVRVDGHAFTVVGVAPKGFRGLLSLVDVQAYLPINMFSIEGRDRGWANSRTSRSLYIMGRLVRGASAARAQASMDVIASRLAQQYPKDWRGGTIETFPGEAANSLFNPTRRTYEMERAAIGLFLGLAGLVLLLACFNVANILLVRATTREHEVAVRAALGASRGRLIRQVILESLLLALLGGVGGLVIGGAASRMLSSLHLGVGVPVALDFTFDWRVFAVALSFAALSGIVVGVVPAIRASRAAPADSLREGGRSIAEGHVHLRHILVVGQLAGTMVLLVVAGLFIRSLDQATRVNLGFNPSHLLNVSMDPHEVGYDPDRAREFSKDLLTHIRALSGVESASLAFTYPTSEYSEDERVYVEGHFPPPGQVGPSVFNNSVSPGYFKTTGIPILEGRGFEDTDTQSAPAVAVVNQTMAREFWPNEDPVGKRFKLSSDSHWWIQVVGVARDSKVQELTAKTPPYFYLPLDQDYSQLITLQVRTTGHPEIMIREVEQEIHGLAPGLPIFGVQTMEAALNSPKGFLHYWLGSALATVMGSLALLLWLVGLYGVVSYSTSRRTHEIGIRMALGARPGDIGRMVLGEGLILVAAGILLGSLAAFAVARVMARFVFGVSSHDPATFACVGIVLAVVALIACQIPARRAMKVHPMVALRHQ